MVDSTVITIGLVLLAYLWGSIPTAVLVCHALEIPDPRKQGSGNPGTTNVLRIGSRKAALITLFGDAGKGYLALLPCILLNLDTDIRTYCTLAAIIGHIFPVFSAFRGGKGVATSFGACLGLFWPLAIVQICLWGIVALLSRTSSLAAISTALATPIFIWIMAPQYLFTLCLVGALLIFSHRNNIHKLISGTEPKF